MAPPEKDETIARADNIDRQIAALQSRRISLDSELSEINERLKVLEQARVAEQPAAPVQSAAVVTMTSSADAKVALFRDLLEGDSMSFHVGGKTQRPATLAMHRCAATSGSEAYAESHRSSAAYAQTKPSSRCRMRSFDLTLPAKHRVARRTSRQAFIQCLPMRHVGSLQRISTRSLGCRTLPRFVTRLDRGCAAPGRTLSIRQRRSCVDLLRRSGAGNRCEAVGRTPHH